MRRKRPLSEAHPDRIGGKQQPLPSGSCPATFVRAAFEKAEILKARIRDGPGPRVAERRKAQGTEAPRTVADAAERFIHEHVQAKNDHSRASDAERMFRQNALPKLGIYPLSRLRRDRQVAPIYQQVEMAQSVAQIEPSAMHLMNYWKIW